MSQLSKLIKLCGFRDPASVAQLDPEKVDMVGFIFAPSKRQVQLKDFPALQEAVPAGLKKVGVFVNPTEEELDAVFQLGKLDIVQLHGGESASFCKEVKQNYAVEVIKAIPVGSDLAGKMEQYAEVIDYLLLDTYEPTVAGGTGKTFQWEQIPKFYTWCEQYKVKLLVAGGIHAENVCSLIESWPLHGVDVSSGIETNGVKDIGKIELFLERVENNGNRT
ncbi:phosphoribosylanthranilate isomerase [Ammoniphilus resinae]|uniref:N-(5'-phosphoribosyl)anthranilate isomerase n=1 Tax=Ammoniphilus resinae TaxID=861532 RepID=A0ABS4GTR5_9BACL|nr:phosphoribosylanthranilate isomerase [Ammoniphilus resinae]MBP1933442.1 phosphoribosylanthranilate isomerase [Ammoniphilus resinae]